tara:strand:+ start:329 stop:862 length:534 start_codon:yes stop_codon:yes gene_type:complete
MNTQDKLDKVQETILTRVANLFAKYDGKGNRGQVQITAETPAKMKTGGRAKNGVYPNPLANEKCKLHWTQGAEFVPYSVARAEYIERTGEEIAERGANPAESYVNDCPAIIHNANTGNIRIQYRPLGGKQNVKLLVNGKDATPEQIEIYNRFQSKSKSADVVTSVMLDNIKAFTPMG